jgi:hypothetical protein
MAFPGNGKWVPPPDYADAFATGLACLHCEVGRLRIEGTTITQDEEEGVAWLRSAAVGGNGKHYSACLKAPAHSFEGNWRFCVRT